jgi:hypothetical protein
MATVESCAKCVDLWHRYAIATGKHVALIKEDEERNAGLTLARFAELDSQIETASAQRLTARAATEIHLAADHA